MNNIWLKITQHIIEKWKQSREPLGSKKKYGLKKKFRMIIIGDPLVKSVLQKNNSSTQGYV